MSPSEPAGIQAISKADVHRITSGQVVLDIQSAVKELIENALDAGAKAIEIRFKEHGSESIEVVDNGSGIREDNYASLALKHHTSKLSSFHDLTFVQTFGFRGEALSSLCELSDVQIVTATKEEEPVGVVLELNRDGTIRSQDKKVARQRGTTVTISNLFSTLPVRRRELLKNIKREFAKAQALLQAYAIISRGVRWVVSNNIKGRKTNIMTINGSDDQSYIRSNTSAVFGTKACTSLIPLELSIPLQHQSKARVLSKVSRHMPAEDESSDKVGMDEDLVKVQGLISRPTHGSGRSASDRIFLYLNGRPWDSSRIVRALNEVYKTFNSNQYPLVVANFVLEGDRYDVNVSPDKRTLFLHDETAIIEGLKTALEDFFHPYLSTFTVNGAKLTAAKDAATQSQLAFKPRVAIASQEQQVPDRMGGTPEERAHPIEAGSCDDHIDGPIAKRPRLESQDSLESRPGSDLPSADLQAISETAYDEEEDVVVLDSTSASWSPTKQSENEATLAKEISRGRNASQATIEAKLSNARQPAKSWSSRIKSFAAPYTLPDTPQIISTEDDNDDDDEEDGVDMHHLEYREEGLTSEQEAEVAQQRQEYYDELMPAEVNAVEEEDNIEREANLARLEKEGAEQNGKDTANGWKSEMLTYIEDSGDVMQITLDMAELRQRIVSRSKSYSAKQPITYIDDKRFDHAGVEEKDAGAVESTLSRSIDKADFAAMSIIGQFNLGFIIARRVNGEEDDVFIIDQHAADEKYNFETLQRETKLKSQTLIRPRQLELPSSVEFVAAQHIDTLAAHGFLVKVDEEAMPGTRVELQALPISKDTAFGVAELEELLYKLAEVAPDSQRARSIRCTRLYNVFASRACRKSVMIGKALTKRQMSVILQHMGEIEQPWNCPHGRPTMRHLLRLDTYPSLGSSINNINWQSLL